MEKLLESIYNTLTIAPNFSDLRDVCANDIDIIYKPRGDSFVISTDNGEYYRISILPITWDDVCDFRKQLPNNP